MGIPYIHWSQSQWTWICDLNTRAPFSSYNLTSVYWNLMNLITKNPHCEGSGNSAGECVVDLWQAFAETWLDCFTIMQQNGELCLEIYCFSQFIIMLIIHCVQLSTLFVFCFCHVNDDYTQFVNSVCVCVNDLCTLPCLSVKQWQQGIIFFQH